MTTGQRIKQRRLELKMSVDELAQKLGKNRATVYRYENNTIETLPTSILVSLAKVLETTPAYLMGWNIESKRFEDEINGFLLTLKSIGWTYTEEYDSENYSYDFSDGRITLKITPDEYSRLVKSNQDNLKQELQKLLLKSPAFRMQKSPELDYLTPVAAHERTDIEVTQEMIDHDDDIMDDDDF